MLAQKSDQVVIDGMMYPRLTRRERWIHRQRWLCRIGIHYFIPVGKRPGFRAELCACGRCSYSTWCEGRTWKLQTRLGYWKQAGHPIPFWTP